MYFKNKKKTDKQILDKKNGDADKNIPDVSGFVITTALNTKIGDPDNKIANTSNLVSMAVLNTKFGEV